VNLPGDLPANLPGLHAGSLPLRWIFPLPQGRSGELAGIYWSDDDGYGLMHPCPAGQHHRAGSSAVDALAEPRAGLLDALLNRVIYRLASRLPQGEISSPALVDSLLGKQPCRILSIGLDPRGMWSTVAQDGHVVTSVERTLIPRTAEEAAGIRALAGTAENLPSELHGESFDAVAMIHCLSRAQDPVLAIRNAASLLKPGGVLWIDVPNFRSTGFDLMGPSWFHANAGQHLHFFSGESLAAVVAATGMSITTVHHFGFSRQFYWTGVESALWDSLYRAGTLTPANLIPRRPSLLAKLRLLRATLRGSAEKRYDSVRVVARK
jgi:SAM-dependent methyltransferase